MRRELSSCPRLDAASPRRIEASASRNVPRRQEIAVILRYGDSLTLLRRVDRRFVRLAIWVNGSFGRPTNARCRGCDLVHGSAARIVSRCFYSRIFWPGSRRCRARHGGTPYAFRSKETRKVPQRSEHRAEPGSMPRPGPTEILGQFGIDALGGLPPVTCSPCNRWLDGDYGLLNRGLGCPRLVSSV